MAEDLDGEDLPPEPPDDDEGLPHAPSRRPSGSRAQSRSRRKSRAGQKGPPSREWWLKTFNEMAAKGSYALGEASEAVLPTTSSVLQIRSPVVGDAVEEAARRDARVFAVAKLVYESQIYVLFITTLGAILLAIAIDLGRMPVYAVDVDEGHVAGINPLARFTLPRESLDVAIGVQRRYRAQRAATAAQPEAGPVKPPSWYAGPDASPARDVGAASGVAG